VQLGETQWFGSPQLRILVNLQTKLVLEHGPISVLYSSFRKYTDEVFAVWDSGNVPHFFWESVHFDSKP